MPGKEQLTWGFNFVAKKPTMDELLTSRDELNRTSADFLKVDLETALTFSGIALQNAANSIKRQRNQRNARLGYDTIVRLIQKVTLSDEEIRSMAGKLQRLKTELQQLGETF
jgi:hypothetical protein